MVKLAKKTSWWRSFKEIVCVSSCSQRTLNVDVTTEWTCLFGSKLLSLLKSWWILSVKYQVHSWWQEDFWFQPLSEGSHPHSLTPPPPDFNQLLTCYIKPVKSGWGERDPRLCPAFRKVASSSHTHLSCCQWSLCVISDLPVLPVCTCSLVCSCTSSVRLWCDGSTMATTSCSWDKVCTALPRSTTLSLSGE